MQRLVIVGVGGHGRELLDIVEAVNIRSPTFDFLGFVDDDGTMSSAAGSRHAALLGAVRQLEDIDAGYILGIGTPEARRDVDTLVTGYGRQAAVLVHPETSIGSDVALGAGTILAAGARITTHVEIGRHVHLNISATVSHDCVLHDYATLSPGCHLSGNVTLGACVLIGTGAVVNPGIRIGAGSIVGSGAAVTRDVPEGVVVAGVPARILRDR